ncbi:MAG: aminotransferase class I/II-fold pyridoxal phosphate-dependent enzyme, partial [Cyanobacteria bacterium P01_D01_bin.71]
IYQAMAKFKDFTSICSSAPSEFLSILALRNRDKIIQRNRAIIAANIEICDRFFSNYADRFNWMTPKGGSTAFPSLKQAVDVEEFCINLVNQKGVLLLPSTYFDYGKQNFRIGLGRKNLSECMEKLDDYLQIN